MNRYHCSILIFEKFTLKFNSKNCYIYEHNEYMLCCSISHFITDMVLFIFRYLIYYLIPF